MPNQSEPAGKGDTAIHDLTVHKVVAEFRALLKEGWVPELDEFLARAPARVRDEVRPLLEQALAEQEATEQGSGADEPQPSADWEDDPAGERSDEEFVDDYVQLLDEGWTPDVEEFLDMVPEARRDTIRTAIEAVMEDRRQEALALATRPRVKSTADEFQEMAEPTGPAGTVADLVSEYERLLDQGLIPDVDEFLERLPESLRPEASELIRAALDERYLSLAAPPLTTPESEQIVAEYKRLLDEGWRPDADEYLARVPESLRVDVEADVRRLRKEADAADAAAGGETVLESEQVIAEYKRLLDEGWRPDVDEFLNRVPESLRVDVEAEVLRLREDADAEVAAAERETGRTLAAIANEVCRREGKPVPAPEPEPAALGQEAEGAFAVFDVGAEPEPEPDPAPAPPQGEVVDAGPEEIAALFASAGVEEIPAPAEEPPSLAVEIEQPVEHEQPVEYEQQPVEYEQQPVEYEQPAVEYEQPAEYEQPVAAETLEDESAAPPVVAGLRHEHDLGPRTFLAYDEARARYVVAKRLAPGTPDDVQQAALAEAKRAFDLQDETIVAADSLAKDALVSEFVEGEPFDVAASQLSFGRCTRLLLSAARALMAAHEAGIPHLGLAPDRMLVTPSRNVRIVGFGFGAVEPERGDAFAAPEQLQNGEIWQPADVFSFGAVMYAVLAGRAPFGGATPEQVRESIAARLTLPRQIDPSIPADLQALCLSCLERDPHQRPLMYDVVVELERIVAGQPVRVRPHHYRDLVRAGLREHGAQLDLWEQQGIATADQRDAVEVVYRRISDQEEHWLFDTRRITLRRVALYAGCALFAAAITAFAWFGGTGMLPLIAVVVVFGAGLFAQLRDELAGACAFLGAGCVAAAPAVYAFQPEPVVAAGVALALSLFSFLRVRVALFAWTTVAFTAATVVGVAQQFGFAPEGYAALAALLPLSLLLPRAAWAQPFRWAGALALVAAPFAVGARVPDVLDFTFLDTWYAALAAHGLLLIGLQAWLDRTSNVDMRRTARAFEWAGVGMVTSALFANALAHGTGLALAVYVAAPVLLLAISPWRGRRVFLVAGLLGLAAACYLPVAMGAMSLGAFALTAAGTGAALAFGVLIPSLRK